MLKYLAMRVAHARLCGDECGPCSRRICVVDLPCGHQANNISCEASRKPASIWYGYTETLLLLGVIFDAKKHTNVNKGEGSR